LPEKINRDLKKTTDPFVFYAKGLYFFSEFGKMFYQGEKSQER